MSLLISLKDKVSQALKEPDLANAFRQVENWANAYSWSTLALAAGWSGNPSVRFLVDPLGFVHLHGDAQFTGTPVDNQLILTLPKAVTPQSTWRFATVYFTAATFVDLNADRSVRFRSTVDAPGANHTVTLDFIYDPRV